jgi:hypothetical protein
VDPHPRPRIKSGAGSLPARGRGARFRRRDVAIQHSLRLDDDHRWDLIFSGSNLLRYSALAPSTGALPSPLPLSITIRVAWSILATTPLPMVAVAIRHSIPFRQQNAPVNVAPGRAGSAGVSNIAPRERRRIVTQQLLLGCSNNQKARLIFSPPSTCTAQAARSLNLEA